MRRAVYGSVSRLIIVKEKDISEPLHEAGSLSLGQASPWFLCSVGPVSVESSRQE